MPVYYGSQSDPNDMTLDSGGGSSALEPTTLGETPYTGQKQNFIQKIMRGLGQRRINQLVGGLGAQAGQQDRYGTWINGPDPFQAGIQGSALAGKAYDATAMNEAAMVEKAILDRRRTQAAETTAQAAKDRAASYGEWVSKPRPGAMTPSARNQDRLDWWNKLSPEEQKAAQAAGLAPRPQVGRAPNRIQMHVDAIKEQIPGITDEEAAYLASVSPTNLGSVSESTIDPNTYNMTTKSHRQLGLPAMARKILESHGVSVEDFFGMTGGGEGPTFAEGTPQSRDEVDQIEDPRELEPLMEAATNGTLTPAQAQWVYDRYDELQQMIEDGEIPDPYAGDNAGGGPDTTNFGPDRYSQ